MDASKKLKVELELTVTEMDEVTDVLYELIGKTLLPPVPQLQLEKFLETLSEAFSESVWPKHLRPQMSSKIPQEGLAFAYDAQVKLIIGKNNQTKRRPRWTSSLNVCTN